MRKLALSDDILLSIEKPARYIGGEVNSVMKDKNEVDIRFAMCFPDVYEIGMSHLGIQILYDIHDSRNTSNRKRNNCLQRSIKHRFYKTKQFKSKQTNSPPHCSIRL